MRKCKNCLETVDRNVGYTVCKQFEEPKVFPNGQEYRIPYLICSPTCLVEWAWKEKESQPKLSKSKISPMHGGGCEG